MLTLLTLIACDAEVEETTDPAVEEPTEETAEVEDFAPDEGTWMVTDETLTGDSCGMFKKGSEETDSDFIITNTEEGWFEVSSESNPLVYACETTGMDFDCPAFAAEEIDLAPDFDMVITMSIWSGGTFTDASTLEGSKSLDVTCEGVDCPFAPKIMGGMPVPCSVYFDFSAAAAE